MSPWLRSHLLRTLLLLSICGSARTGKLEFDCQAARHEAEQAWSDEQKAWCCEHQGVRCLSSPREESAAAADAEHLHAADFSVGEYDCMAGYERWESGWSLAKKTWCCFNEGHGCTPSEREYAPAKSLVDRDASTTKSARTTTSAKPATTSTKRPSTTSTKKLPRNTTTTLTATTTVNCSTASKEEEASWSFDTAKHCCVSVDRGCDLLSSFATTTTTAAGSRPLGAGSAEYNCSVGFSYWQQLWSVEKKAYCCEQEGKACPEAVPAKISFDCLADLGKWQDKWDTNKTAWCCHTQGLGCGTTTKWEPFDCTLEARGWSTEKADWCCHHKSVGCPTTTLTSATKTTVTTLAETESTVTTTTSTSSTSTTSSTRGSTTTSSSTTTTTMSWKYECHDESHNSHQWSRKKRLFCCDQVGIGCFTTTSPPYDCSVAYNNWAAGWSDTKKAWCCEKESKGCVPTITSSTETTTTIHHKHTHTSSATSMTTTTDPRQYDCGKGLHNWKLSWSISKMNYCCFHHQRGCTTSTSTTSTSVTSTTTTTSTSTVTETHDCDRQFSTWRSDWSDKKKDWCCKHKNKGCAGGSKPFDCSAGFNNWKKGWSEGKKVWCCRFEAKACKDDHEHHTTQSTTHRDEVSHEEEDDGDDDEEEEEENHDCLDGIDDSEDWTHKKRKYCCDYMGIACGDAEPERPENSEGRYDCHAGYLYTNWKKTWSSDKKKWCCSNERLGCDRGTTTDAPTTTSTTTSTARASRRRRSSSGRRRSSSGSPKLYDCDEGIDNWFYEWSPGKRVWCCLHENEKCLKVTMQQRPEEPDHGEPHYDCDSAADNAQMAWSIQKQEWCCSKGKGGCREEVHRLFDASRPQGLATWTFAVVKTPFGLVASLGCCAAALAAAVALATACGRARHFSRLGHQRIPLIS